MFQFPTFARNGLCIQPLVTPSGFPVTPGFPIRRSQDQCLFDGSPGLIAACRVLHRLITPRHPPCTLSSLITFTAGRHRPTAGNVSPSKSSFETSPSPRSRPVGRRRDEDSISVNLATLLPYAIVKELSQTARRPPALSARRGRYSTIIRPNVSSLKCYAGAKSHASTKFALLQKNPSPRLVHAMETTGLEPAASSLQSWRSPN